MKKIVNASLSLVYTFFREMKKNATLFSKVTIIFKNPKNKGLLKEML